MDKTSELLTYIAIRHPRLTITSLMKIAYLVDLVYIKKTNGQISDFKYRRYKYGPFDSTIYTRIQKLISDGVIIEDVEYNPYGEHAVYCCDNDDGRISLDTLSDNERGLIDEVVDSVIGYGPKALVELAYKTKPMKSIGATIGGNEHLNELLNLKA